MAFLLHLQPGMEITPVLCLRFNAKLEEIYGCPTSPTLLCQETWTSVTKLLGAASTWWERYPLVLSIKLMFGARLISAPSASRASVLLETPRGTQMRNNAVSALSPACDDKLLSHESFEMTEKPTSRAVSRQGAALPATPGPQCMDHA